MPTYCSRCLPRAGEETVAQGDEGGAGMGVVSERDGAPPSRLLAFVFQPGASWVVAFRTMITSTVRRSWVKPWAPPLGRDSDRATTHTNASKRFMPPERARRGCVADGGPGLRYEPQTYGPCRTQRQQAGRARTPRAVPTQRGLACQAAAYATAPRCKAARPTDRQRPLARRERAASCTRSACHRL